MKDFEDMQNEEFMAAMNRLKNGDTYIEDEDSTEIKKPDDNIVVDTETKGNDVAEEHEVQSEAETEEDDGLEPDPTEDESESSEDEDESVSVEIHEGDSAQTPEEYKDFEKYKQFYDAIQNGELEIDGVKLNSITDPEKLLEIQQKSISDSRKLDEFSDVKPVLKTIRDSGLKDPKRLATVVEALSGNPEALKLLIKESGVDPLELDYQDIDNSKIDENKYIQSDVELAFDGFIDNADKLGVKDQLVEKVVSGWDSESLAKLSTDGVSGSRILRHIKSGAFDEVKAEMINQERLDTTGEFKSMNDFDRYAYASNIVAENKSIKSKEIVDVVDEPVKKEIKKEVKKTPVSDKKNRIEKAKKASESTSSSKPVASKDSKTDLMDLNNEDFMAEMRKYL